MSRKPTLTDVLPAAKPLKAVTPLSRIVATTVYSRARQALGDVPPENESLHDDAVTQLGNFLHVETNNLSKEVADLIARGITRINGVLTVPHSLLGHNGMETPPAFRVRTLLSALGIAEEDVPSQQAEYGVAKNSKKSESKVLRKTHFRILDVLMGRILGIDENGKKIEKKRLPNTYLVHIGGTDFTPYVEMVSGHLSLTGADSFLCEGADIMKDDAIRARGKDGWDATLRIFQKACAREIKKGKPSVLFVPLDTLVCFKEKGSKILASYARAIDGARKKGKTIILMSQRGSQAHKNDFGDGLYGQLFGSPEIIDQDNPKYVRFSPKPCEINRHNQAYTFQLLYEEAIMQWSSDTFFDSLSSVAALPLFGSLDSTAVAQKEIHRRIHFLQQLSLFIAMRGKPIHIVPPITQQGTRSEMENLLEQIQLSKYTFTPALLGFIQKTLRVNCDPIEIRRYLWKQYCLSAYQTGEMGNALQRSSELLSEPFSQDDTLGIWFEYYLAKTVFREKWAFSGLPEVTSWDEAKLNEFESLNRANTELLDESLGSFLTSPEPFKTADGIVVSDTLDFVSTHKKVTATD